MSRVAVVVKGYPRLSETFIAQEIFGLEARGVAQLIVALRRPYDPYRHPVHARIAAPVLYLPEYIRDDPQRVAKARAAAMRLPGFEAARALYDADREIDRGPARARRFAQACVMAAELPADIDWIHCHYLHAPASVVRYAACMRGLPWSYSAHAKDVWTTPAWDLRAKLAAAAWGVTCTEANARHLRALGGAGLSLERLYHGLDFSEFPEPPDRVDRGDGRRGPPVRLVSVGRLVEKKGYADLLSALARLPADLDWRFEHIGSGALGPQLQARAARLGLADRIVWRGARPRGDVIAVCMRGDLFVLPARIARSGDRDGLPNVLMEA